MVVLSYQPGQVAEIVLSITSGGVRVDPDTGTTPKITNILIPNPPAVITVPPTTPSPLWITDPNTIVPIGLVRFETGLWGGQYQIGTGASAIGIYILDVQYILAGVTYTETYQLVVNAPFGLFSVI
jgi:hypothetical protein